VTELEELFRRRADWQKSRAQLSWSEKLKLAEVLRDAAMAMRRPSQVPRCLGDSVPRNCRGS
jgi:hypothetical protein